MRYLLEKTGIHARFETWRASRQAQQEAEEQQRLQAIDEYKAGLFGKKNWEWAKSNREIVEALGGEFFSGWFSPESGGLNFIVILFKGNLDLDADFVRQQLRQLDSNFSEEEFQSHLGENPWFKSRNLLILAREVVIKMLKRDGIMFDDPDHSPFDYGEIRFIHPDEARLKQ